MRVYHGTSFENACKILSQEYWSFPVELSLKSEYDCNMLIGRLEYIHSNRVLQNFNHFTTSLSTAKSYAELQNKPVVLFFDYDIKEGCDDFVITEPIPTDLIKCIQVIIKSKNNDKGCNYGMILNYIYNKLISEPSKEMNFVVNHILYR